MRPTYPVNSKVFLHGTPRRPRKPKRARGLMWQAVLTMGLFAALGIGTVSLLGTLGWLPTFNVAFYGHEPMGPAGRTLTETQAGLILFTSPNRDTCRQQLFDNSTGWQRDEGVVDCKGALYKVKQNKIAQRLNAIGDGFRQK